MSGTLTIVTDGVVVQPNRCADFPIAVPGILATDFVVLKGRGPVHTPPVWLYAVTQTEDNSITVRLCDQDAGPDDPTGMQLDFIVVRPP